MSSMTWPDHLLSLDEWADLPVEEDRHCELVEGVLLVSPRPSRPHQWAILSLAAELNTQLADDLTALPESEVVIAGGPAATAGGVCSTLSEGPTAQVTRPTPLRIDLPTLLTRR